MAQRAEFNEEVSPILSAHEAYEVFDREVQRLMGISGDEFMERWEMGEWAELADQPEHRHIMRLVLMMPRAGHRSS